MWIVNSEIIYAVTGFLFRVISPSHKNVWIENTVYYKIKYQKIEKLNYDHLSLYLLNG